MVQLAFYHLHKLPIKDQDGYSLNLGILWRDLGLGVGHFQRN